MLSFGDLMRKLMKERGMTQIEMSELLGVRQSQVSNWLNGKSLPGYKSIKIICKNFNISADYLVGLVDTNK